MELKHDERTPCEVVVAPGTIFGIGVPVETIIHAIRERGMFPGVPKELASASQWKKDGYTPPAVPNPPIEYKATNIIVGYALKKDDSSRVHQYDLNELEFAREVAKEMPEYKLYPILLGQPL